MLSKFTVQFSIVGMPEHRSYRKLLAGRLISALGTWTAFFAVRIALYNQTNSAWWVSILLFAELVPGVILGIAVGPLIDRWPRQRMMILSDLGGAACFGVLPFVHSPAGICAVSALAGFSAAFFRPACYAAIPNLVGEKYVVTANALIQGAENLATLMGPVIAGVGIVLLGPSTVYTLNAVSFLFSALLLARVGSRLQSNVAARIGRTHWREVRAGFSLVRRDNQLSSLFLIWSWATLAYTGINVAEIVLTTDAYGVGSAGFGVFVAFSAAGILIGNLVAPSFIGRLTVYGGYRASFLITAAGVTICAVSPNLTLGCVGAALFGVGNGIGLVCNVTLIQQVVADDRRGQIFAVLGSLVQMFTLIGTLAAGPLTMTVGPRMVWGISAALLVIGYLNTIVISALRRSNGVEPASPTFVLPSIEAGGETPGNAFNRIATLLDEVERTREAEAPSGIGRRRSRGADETRPPPS
ncbi:MAG: MFS transporter [Thermoleophilia bacterium]|nr:MFS transporter [Thermoleophilia bacterium]